MSVVLGSDLGGVELVGGDGHPETLFYTFVLKRIKGI